MIINQELLGEIYVGLSTLFNSAFQAAPDPWYKRLAMTVPSAGRSIDYKFLLDFPGMREWLGERVIKSLAGKSWEVINKNWESTIEVFRNDIADDQIGLYNPIVSALGQEAAHHPNQLIADLINDGGIAECYDGENFFDTDHPVGTGTASNYDAGASTAWYLLDVSRPVKPFIFQSRKPVQLTRMDRETDINVFMRNSFLFGVDARYAVAYGMWQLAFKSTQTLNSTYYQNARAAMMDLENAEGRKLGIRPNLLVVPPSLEGTARELLNAQFVLGDDTAGGAKSNIWQGTADLLVVPEL
ncbi:MAG: Mu-like prophage major head subunit gpT family protein [Saccharofermentanales bacterium]|jgi:phage major head subunit gpT-like protein